MKGTLIDPVTLIDPFKGTLIDPFKGTLIDPFKGNTGAQGDLRAALGGAGGAFSGSFRVAGFWGLGVKRILGFRAFRG